MRLPAAGRLAYLRTLQPADGGTVLASGWNGLAAAGVIGVALLAAAWAALRQRDESEQDGSGGGLGWLAGLVLLGGLLFVNLAPLFVLPWHFAAMVWPVTGVATLWWAIRSRQWAALAFALGLQLVAGAQPGQPPGLARWRAKPDPDAKPFLHSGFWSPLLIALAAFAAARLLHRRQDEPLSMALGCRAGMVRRLVGLCLGSRVRPGAAPGNGGAQPHRGGSRHRRIVGNAGQDYRLAAVGAGDLHVSAGAGCPAGLPDEAGRCGHPLEGWGALVWPLALLLHGLLLRGQKDWLAPELHGAVHTAGAWLFTVIAALEIHWHLAAGAARTAPGRCSAGCLPRWRICGP